MSTTTIRLDDDTKARVAEAASRAGVTAHAFIVEAITRTLDAAEQREAFVQLADARWARISSGGDAEDWEAVKGALRSRADAIARKDSTQR